ncbi:MAG: formyltetrahydrofolate deformylase [Candidatus Nanopelagicaceae bacterium]|nr:formyltetrahydrofolate deformylase [Candidatus Nanopelagicaceae bacterium]
MEIIATLQCEDRSGIVNALTSAVLEINGNILENQQFTDSITNTFVMRTRFETEANLADARSSLSGRLAHYSPNLQVRDANQAKRALILVTKASHCLRDLLYLRDLEEMPAEFPVVIGNHEDLRPLVESHGIPFNYLDTEKLAKNEVEREIAQLAKTHSVDFIILARYMQILSSDFCNKFANRIINIHHSFLPGFKGARPYHQAHAKGVKVIGATAHFVTSDLDEGPIIEQDVTRVNHAATPEEFVAIGRDIERRVLSSAVKLFAEDRIFIVGNRTIVFSK